MTTLSNLQAIARERDEAVTALKHTWATLEKTVAALERALAAAQTWKGIALQREEAHEEALAGGKEALDDAELDRTLDSLRAIFDDIAPRLFPWELAAFATHATETVARLVPSSVVAERAGR